MSSLLTLEPVIFDIETVPRQLPASIVEHRMHNIRAPKSWKDKTKIKAYKDGKKRELRVMDALNPDYSKIVALGYTVPQDDATVAEIYANEEAEKIGIEKFFKVVLDNDSYVTSGHHAEVGGFNSYGFDIPIITQRALYLNIQTPITLLGWDYDVALAMTCWNRRVQFKSLGEYLQLFGFERNKISGSQVPDLYAKKQYDKITTHVMEDVVNTRQLWRILKRCQRIK